VFPRRGKQLNPWAQVAFYSSLGFILPVATVGGYFLGSHLDRWLHSAPALAVLLGIVGAAAGIYEVLKILMRAERRASGNNSDNRPNSS